MSEPVKCGCEGQPHVLDVDAAVAFGRTGGRQIVCLGDMVTRVMAGEPLTDLDRRAIVTLALLRVETNALINAYNDAVLDNLPVKGRAN